MKPFRRTLSRLYLPLVAMIFAIQAFAVVHQVKHDILGGADTCAICSVAGHSVAPAPTAPAIATVSTVELVAFTPTYEAPRLVQVQTRHQSRAPPVFSL
jgi:hypothetical protein